MDAKDPTTHQHLESRINNLNDHDAQLYQSFASRDAEWHDHMTKQLLRKVDTRLLPILVLMYLLNFLDRTNLAQARLGTLEKDLRMDGTNFNTATSVLFVGYILMQLPSNLLLTRLRPSIYLGTVMAVWGAISAAQAGAHSYAGLVVARFFLGVVEAPFFPGALFLMSSWYKRDELAHRYAFFYAGSALANMFGGLLAAGVLGNLEGAHGISGWRWLFIIEGVITIGIAIASIFLLPDYPATTKWLTPDERNYAQWRLISDTGEADHADGLPIWQAIKLSFTDYRLYLFILLQHCNLLSQSFTYFFPTIVNTLGYPRVTTLLLTVPVWFATFCVSLAVTIHASRTNERTWHIVIPMMVACVGNVIVTSTTNTGARFFAMFLMPMGALPAFQVILAWVANSFPRPARKRAVCMASVNMLGNVASIYGPYMYPSTDSPRYLAGGSATAGVCLACAAMALAVRFCLKRENAKLEMAEEREDEEGAAVGQGEDVRAAGFRYII
ncbi:uncharacterized protein LAJ45_04029 [Morchella importuna]|uniref:uncharacterized protein n=1 Tax=Morchella importuna TaxID=1174673 RepID=UPI001E8D7C6D|nr:uncharacterized protein LAJ45_04029 [Morchella importuna]KAH8152035.1 hypothetical protein LAJ45_04029 [Morchella importuna]